MSIAEKLTTIAENVQKVYEAGEKSEYDRFWDNFQRNGEKIPYTYAFQSSRWNDDNYNPKYPINASNATNIFVNNKNITDTKVPIILTGTTINNTFAWSGLVTIRELIVDETTKQASNAAGFIGLSSLQNLTITGTIAFDLNLMSSPLTTASVLSVLTALTKDSTLASGRTVTFMSELQASIEADIQCAEQIALAVASGWTVAYA